MAYEISNNRAAVYTYLMNASPLVKLTTGAVLGDIVRHDYVLVHSAPAKVVREIVNNFRMVELTPDGMLIPLAKEEEYDTDSDRSCGCGGMGLHGVDHND
jgi:hypothetical protein